MDPDSQSVIVMQRIAAGDKSAMRECLDLFGDLVWSMALKYLRREDAEETVQDIFLELWHKADRFDPARGKPVTFIAILARRRILDRLRQVSRRRDPEPLDASRTLASIPEAAAFSGQGVISDRLDRVETELRSLSKDQQQAIELVIGKGYTQVEAAQLMSIPLGTLKSHVRRGLECLRQNLKQSPTPSFSS